MADENEILFAIKELKSWLYGADGHEGDIPEMKSCLKEMSTTIKAHDSDIILLKERESFSKKQVVGITGIITVAITAILQFLASKLGWK